MLHVSMYHCQLHLTSFLYVPGAIPVVHQASILNEQLLRGFMYRWNGIASQNLGRQVPETWAQRLERQYINTYNNERNRTPSTKDQ